MHESDPTFHSAVIDALPYPAWVIGPEGGLEHANRSLLGYSGRTPAELSSSGWHDLVHAEDRNGLAERVASSLGAGAPFTIDVRLDRKSEGPRWHSLSFAPVGARWLATGFDVHQRKLDEAELRERADRFRLIGDVSNDGAFYWDVRTNAVFWTDRQLDLLGFTRDEWDNSMEGVMKLTHPDDQAIMAGAVRAHLEERAPYAFEVRLQHKSGEYRTCQVRGQAEWDENGVPLRMGGGLADITERRRMEIALRDQLRIIEQQKEAISKLSAPIIEVWDGVVTMPLLGAIDARRAGEMTERLLQYVTRTGCGYAIIDLTGIEVLDTGSADNIIKLIRAVQLLGAQGVVVGIRPDAAQTLASLGVDLSHITTLANLRQALQFAMRGGVSKKRSVARAELNPAAKR